MNKIDFSYFTKIFRSFFDSDRSKAEVNPRRDWFLAVLVFIIVLVASGGVHLFIYQKLIISNQNVVGQPISTVKLDVQTINSLASEFKTKEIQFNDYLKTKPVIVDPSR